MTRSAGISYSESLSRAYRHFERSARPTGPHHANRRCRRERQSDRAKSELSNLSFAWNSGDQSAASSLQRARYQILEAAKLGVRFEGRDASRLLALLRDFWKRAIATPSECLLTLVMLKGDILMLKLFTLRPILLGVVSAALAFPTLASADCGDATQAPPERSAACEAALKTATDPVERARLLIFRAQSNTQQIKMDAASQAIVHLGEIDYLLPDINPQMRADLHAERGRIMLRAQSNRQQMRMDTTSQAMADLAAAERLLPDMKPQMRADLLVERAEIHRLSQDRSAAFADLDEAERLNPGAADPVVSRSLLLFDQGKEKGASEQLARALKLEPDNARALYHTMRLAELTGNIPGCIEYGSRALNVSPRDTRIFAMRARCLAESGRTTGVEADIRRIEEIGPWAPVVLDDMALAFLVLDRPGEAVAAARRAIQMDPSFQDAYFELTTALMATGAYDEALSTFRVLRKAGVEDRIGLANNVAWELYLAGRYTDAIQIVDDWFAANTKPIEEPNNIANTQGYPVVIDTAAHVLAALGRQEESVASFLRAAKMSPGKFRSKYEERLAALGFAVKDGDAGLEAALRACVATGTNCRLYGDDRRRRI